MLKSDKRGISIMIGYIILIAMAVGLSVMVFNWLTHYIPEQDQTQDMCPEDVSVTFRDISCSSMDNQLSFTIRNNGLFSIDGFLVRVNDQVGADLGIYLIEPQGNPLAPQESDDFAYDYSDHVQGFREPYFQSNLKLLEVVPYVMINGEQRVCQPIREELQCDTRPEVCFGGEDEDRDGFVDCADSDCTYDFICSRDDPSLFTHATFDNPSDPTQDSSSYGNDVATYGTGLEYRSGEGYDGGSAYYFDGANGGIELLDDVTASSLGDDFSVSVLISPVTSGNLRARVFTRDCSDFWCVVLDQTKDFPDQEFGFYSDVDNQVNYAGVTLPASQWYHLVGVWDGVNSQFDFYLNGSLVYSQPYGAVWKSPADSDGRSIGLGANVEDTIPANSLGTFKGLMDDPRVYNYPLDSEQVEQLFLYYTNTGL